MRTPTHHTARLSDPARTWLAAATFFLLLGLLTASAFGRQSTPDGIGDQTIELTRQWLGIARQRENLERHWQQQRSNMELRITVLEQERDQLRNTLNNRRDSSDEVETQRLALLEEQNKLESEQDELERLTTELQSRLQRLGRQLPPPLAQSWGEARQTARSDQSEHSPLQEMLALLRILSEFNAALIAHDGIIAADSAGTEQQLLARQLYLGAARAWFVSPDGSRAGTGQASAAGWRWTLDPAMDPGPIQAALDILQNNATPILVTLPLDLGSPAPQLQTGSGR